jgi:D-alanyl-lipoteichoic acid acyltransferase DltB (MBOAT superfamily)
MYYLSLEFLLLLLITAYASFLSPSRYRPSILLIAGVVFLAWQTPDLLLWIIPWVLANHLLAIRIQSCRARQNQRQARLALIATLALNFSIVTAFRLVLRDPSAVEGIGLSFMVLMILGHAFDVYRGETLHEKNLARYALFCGFFATCSSGPIERSKRLLPQLSSLPGFHAGRVRSGMILIYFGVFKKLILANTLGTIVRIGIEQSHTFSSPALYLISILGRLQLFFDLAAYTDISRGSARILGIHLSKNFDRPWAAHSFSDFWRRWHITLSTWFRDYVFYPILGSPLSKTGLNGCILLTFLLIGVWHGFSTNMILFGVLHGVLMVIDIPVSRGIQRLPNLPRSVLGWLWGFGFCASLPMFFFYAPNTQVALGIYSRIFIEPWKSSPAHAAPFIGNLSPLHPFLVPIWAMIATAAVGFGLHLFGFQTFRTYLRFRKRSRKFVPALYFCAIWFVLLFGLHLTKTFSYRAMR